MWEQTGDVYVYATGGANLSDVEETVNTINSLIDEFSLPLRSMNGNATRSKDTYLVEKLITNHTQTNLIDCESMLKEVERYWNEGVFRYGLVILVNPQKFEFKNQPSDPEPAVYGWTDIQGLSVLRRFDNHNAIRHEFGHMVGLGIHHPGCAMDWTCTVREFCENCLKEINEIWELSAN